jgi:hypothetical protein
MEATSSSETSVLTKVTQRNIPEDGIPHSHRRQNLKSYIASAGWALQRRRNMFPVRYELGVYILQDDHSHHRENLNFYINISVKQQNLLTGSKELKMC